MRINYRWIGATMPQEFFDVTKRFMNQPLKILVKNDELTLEGIKQFYVNVERRNINLILFVICII